MWPLDLGMNTIVSTVVGLALSFSGVALALWATHVAGSVQVADSSRLVTSGPYARSRHPMYVAWTLVYFGLAMLLQAGWLLILSPILAGWIHWETGREERRLSAGVGSEYEAYRLRVRRYL
jgi:protein-S-isoprenylcysteine O-methyltransferase Ste14